MVKRAKKMKKFITDFVAVIDNKDFRKHIDKWGMIDMDKSDKGKGRIRYAKKLKDLLIYREKIKRPAFFNTHSLFNGYSVPVNLTNPDTKEKITIFSLVDSGANGSVFSHQIAEAIGINWKKGKRIKAFLGEKFTPLYVYRVPILISVSKGNHFYLENVDIMNEARPANIIGRHGFFNHYEVVFHPQYGIKYRFLG